MTEVTYAALAADMNAAAKRIAGNGSILEQLSNDDVIRMRDKLRAYEPTTKSGQTAKRNAQAAVNSRLENLGLGMDAPSPAEAPAADEAPAPQPPARRPRAARQSSTRSAGTTTGRFRGDRPNRAAAPQPEPEVALPASASASVASISRPRLTRDTLSRGERIASTSFVFEVHTHQPSFVKKMNATEFLEKSGNKENVSADVLHVSQDLIDRKNTDVLRELARVRSDYLAFLKGVSVPGGLLTLGNGQYLMPLTLLELIQERTETFVAQREELLNKFEEHYEEIKQHARTKRGGFYNEGDYPSFATIRSKYGVDYRYISNNVPESLRAQSERIYAAEVERVRLECASLVPVIQETLRQQFVGLVEHFRERLGKDETTGKPRTFHASRVTALKDFIATLSDRDLTGDSALQTLAAKANALIDNVDADQIRKNEGLRGSLEKAFTKLTEDAGKLVTTRQRKFKLRDDGDDSEEQAA